MGRKSREKQTPSKEDTERKTGKGRRLVLGAVVLGAVAFGVMTWQSAPSSSPRPRPTPRDTPPSDATTRKPSPPPTPGKSSAKGASPETLEPLQGDWVRPDGGYVLSVTEIDDDGTATARYLNPSPINVGRAEARLEEGVPGLFVELRDRNYPGSTYTLAYDAKADQLVGIYYQATQRASYDVVFVRKP